MALGALLRKPHAHRNDAAVVSFERVTVRYNGAPPALDEVTFDLQPGERVAIVGPNGAGKSTLLKVVAGILPPTSGRADIYGYGPNGHICIGYVPQRSNVDWSFPVSVADVVMMGRVARIGLLRQAGRADWQRVNASLAQVGMSGFASRQIGELSGGQQQRVFIARALAQEAELLLMDEPLTGLDIPAQEAIFEILDHLRADGMTVLVSTHDLQLASDKFDRLMLLKRTLVGFGRPAQVLTPANLQRAYGTHLTVIPSAEGLFALSDTCCDGADSDGHEHNHD
jgi:manganese/iron transport system ATP-binding protein